MDRRTSKTDLIIHQTSKKKRKRHEKDEITIWNFLNPPKRLISSSKCRPRNKWIKLPVQEETKAEETGRSLDLSIPRNYWNRNAETAIDHSGRVVKKDRGGRGGGQKGIIPFSSRRRERLDILIPRRWWRGHVTSGATEHERRGEVGVVGWFLVLDPEEERLDVHWQRLMVEPRLTKRGTR